MSSISNEGFLYINTDKSDKSNKATFIIGKITDINNELVCPGEIMTLLNPDYEEIEPDIKNNNIIYYSPILKGIRIRIYWYNYWHISTINNIYSEFKNETLVNKKIKEQINFDLLNIDNIYYAVITDDKIILTYITEKKEPKLLIPQLEFDHAFKNHMELFEYDIEPSSLKIFIKTLQTDKLITSYNNLLKLKYGILLTKKDGQQIEVWNKTNHIIKMLEKPEHISIYKYYFQSLNREVINNYKEEEHEPEYEYELLMINMLKEIILFIKHYPEYEYECNRITKKINEYLHKDFIEIQDNTKLIEKLKYLLSFNTDEILTLINISPSPSKRNSLA